MKRRYWTVWATAMLLWAGLVSPALAEQSGNHVQDMDEMTVTATKTSVAQELSPITAYSVNREDLDCQPSYYMNNFGEFIRDLPGVSVGQYYPWGPPWVRIGGHLTDAIKAVAPPVMNLQKRLLSVPWKRPGWMRRLMTGIPFYRFSHQLLSP